jgi:transposase-like protein
MANDVIRYSEAFKLKVVSELESGKLESQAAARRKYGIKGGGTIRQWIKKFGKNHLLGKVIRVETPQDADEKKQLEDRIEKLEKALADAKVKEVLNEAYFNVACNKFGVTDIEEFKKKLDVKLSKKGE